MSHILVGNPNKADIALLQAVKNEWVNESPGDGLYREMNSNLSFDSQRRHAETGLAGREYC